MAKSDSIQFDVTINATLEVDRAYHEAAIQEVMYWDDSDLSEAKKYEDAEEEVVRMYQEDLEGQDVDTVNGRAWVCFVEIGGVI